MSCGIGYMAKLFFTEIQSITSASIRLSLFKDCANDDKLVVLFGFRSEVILVSDKCNCDDSKRSDQCMDKTVPGPEIGRGRKREGDI